MYVKLPPRDLNPNPCLPHSINTYTYGVTIAPRVCGGINHGFKNWYSQRIGLCPIPNSTKFFD